MRSRLAYVLALFCGTALPWGTLTRAQPIDAAPLAHNAVALESHDCSVIASDKLLELVALELAPRAVRASSENQDPAATLARVSCLDAQAQLSVHEVTRQQTQTLSLDLTETLPEARTRLVALALSELIATLELEQPAPASAPPERQPEPTPQTPAAPASVRGWLGVGITREGSPRVLAPAIQLGVLVSLGPLPLAIQAELQASRGGRALTTGDLDASNLSGSALLVGLLRTPHLDLTLGPGLRLGYAWLEGTTNDATLAGRSVSGRWWGPSLNASALLRLIGRWSLRCALDLTYVARSLRGTDASGATLYELDGLLFGASLGVSLTLR